MTNILARDTVIIDRYRIIRLLAKGGMGAVYEAIDLRLSNTVALKQTMLTGEKLSRAFEREAQILANLQHPSLPKVIDHFFYDNGQFLVMEMVPGKDLRAMLEERSQPFDVETVMGWADQLFEVLDYLHSRTPPVIHRDIKPQNLKLTPDGRVVLLDFGLAKGTIASQSQVTETRSILGYTPHYAPPEQIQGAGTDARSDLYSLTATLYYLLVGNPPANSPTRVAAKVNEKPDPFQPVHEINPQIPRAMSDVLSRGLALNSEQRFTNVAEMRGALNAARVASAPTVSSHNRLLIPAIVGSAVAVVVILALVVAFVIRNSGPNGTAGTAQTGPGSVVSTQTATHIPSAATNTTDSTTSTPRTAEVPPPPPTEVVSDEDQEQTIDARVEMTAEAREQQTATVQAQEADATATAEAHTASTAQVQADATATRVALLESIQAQQAARVDRHLTGAFGNAISQYNQQMDQLLLDNGYTKNIITLFGKSGLRASQVGPANQSVWVRDLDYAMSGYSYVLGAMTDLRQSVELFLDRTTANGDVPESLSTRYGVIMSPNIWDTRPNLIHAVYAYVAKTGDSAFYRTHRAKLLQAGEWIVRLDENGDGLPDKDDFLYGWYNSVKNSVRHTYAIAKFYAAFRELAELEAFIGEDGSIWEERARTIREGFHQPAAPRGTGYWLSGQAWPIAWYRSDTSVVDVLETFGIFEAVRSGLIAPSDGERYDEMLQSLHANINAFIDAPAPMRLTLEGYDRELLRTDTYVPDWKLDASAPWIVGIAAPVYAQAGFPDDALKLLDAYAQMAWRTTPPVLQFAAGEKARYGAGEDNVYGLAWDSAAWFLAVYGGHYGISMTPAALIIEPHPYQSIPNDRITNLSYQGCLIEMKLDTEKQTYRVTSDQPVRALLRPMREADQIEVNDGPAQDEADIILEPGEEYVVVSLGD